MEITENVQITEKAGQRLKLGRDEQEVQRWMFSLAPLGVAFVFFFIFLLPMNIPDKDIILVSGFAAGFAGLETYWIFRGWQRGEGLTVLLGVLAIGITGVFLWGYINFLSDILRGIVAHWIA